MKSLGVTLGNALHLSPEAHCRWAYGLRVLPDFRCSSLIRCVLYALLFTAESHHPGNAEALWPEPMTRLNAMGMPSIACGCSAGWLLSSSCWFRLVAVRIGVL